MVCVFDLMATSEEKPSFYRQNVLLISPKEEGMLNSFISASCNIHDIMNITEPIHDLKLVFHLMLCNDYMDYKG